MKVSVYLPTKNRLHLLKDAVASVLRQTYDNIELIVVNDGSTDGTREFLDNLAISDIRVSAVHHEVSLGAPKCRNEALNMATGDFVTGIDDDDQFHPERVRLFVELREEVKSFLGDDVILYSQDELMVGTETIGLTRKTGSAVEADLLRGNVIGNQVFARKMTFMKAGGFDEQLPAWQDLDLLLRMLANGNRAVLLDLPTYRFDVSPRQDRISKQERLVREAYKSVSAKRTSLRDRQTLFLQVFAPHYGHKPLVKDFYEFMAMGFWPKGLLQLMMARFGKYPNLV